MSDAIRREAGRLWVAVKYPQSSPKKDVDKDALMEVREFHTTPAKVKAAMGLTINLGNYESARVDVGVELPCYAEEVPEVMARAWTFCEEEIRKQAVEVRRG